MYSPIRVTNDCYANSIGLALSSAMSKVHWGISIGLLLGGSPEYDVKFVFSGAVRAAGFGWEVRWVVKSEAGQAPHHTTFKTCGLRSNL